jgi:plastocyanin
MKPPESENAAATYTPGVLVTACNQREVEIMKAVRGAMALAMATAGLAAAGGAGAGPDKVAYPEGWDKWVRYGTVDRYDTKQYRELYASEAAVKAAREGKPLPAGTVLTMAIYKAQVDAQGSPVKDANGRFRKGELANVAVMEKRAGWGTEYADELRNGEWEYSMFNADGKFNDKANIKACFECHKPHGKQDYVISMASLAGTFPKLAVAARTGTQDVNIVNFAFGPSPLEAAAGKPVTWTNGDDSPHQVSVKGKGLKTGFMLKGQSESLTFDQPGSYEYNCALHPGMKGVVEVK